MEIQPGAWYPFRSASGLAWSWTFHALDLPPFPTITYSPTFVPACQVNPDWPGLSPDVDPAIGIKLLVVYYADHATNFNFYYRMFGGTWRQFYAPPLVFGSFDYGNPSDPRYVPTFSEVRIEMSGATAFHSTLDGVVTFRTR